MAEKSSKHVPKQGADDKRVTTLTLAENLSGEILHFQMIYTGKTSHSLPTAEFPEGFLLRFDKSHWSNEEETLRLMKEFISPYITKVKKKLKLYQNQVACLIWEAFKAEARTFGCQGRGSTKEYDTFASTFRLNNKRSFKVDGAT